MILNSPYITGSITVTGNANVQGTLTVTGSLSGTATSASLALNSNLLQGTGSVGFSTTASLLEVSSSQQQISSSLLQVSASYIALSASYNVFSGSVSTRITTVSSSQQDISSSQQQISASLLNVIATGATTGSNSFRADQSITGSLVVSSTITAQTLVVQTVTSSIVYSSGSNNFGNQLANTQTFTGSVNITGSVTATDKITVNNNNSLVLHGVSTSTGYMHMQLANANNTARFAVENIGGGTLAVGSIPFSTILNSTGNYALHLATNNTVRVTVNNSGSVGIGTTSPGSTLAVAGNVDIDSSIAAATLFRAIYSGVAQINIGYLGTSVNYYDANSQIFRNASATEIMRITGSKVGIGTTSPGFILDVKAATNEHFYVGPGVAVSDAVVIGGVNDAANANVPVEVRYATTFALVDASGIKMVVSSSNVGIGTSTPSNILTVVGGAASPVALSLANANSNCDITMTSGAGGSLVRLRNNLNDFQIHTNGTLALTLASNQAAAFASSVTAVGAITTNANFINSGPVYSTTGGVGNILFTNTYPSTYNVAQIASVLDGYYYAAKLIFRTADQDNANLLVDRLTIASRGAATFSSTIQTNGNAYILPTITGGGSGGLFLGVYPDTQYTKQAILLERYASTDGNYGRGNLHFCNRNTGDANQPTLADSRMVITSGGNIGIGTTAPAELLHVYSAGTTGGNIRMTDAGLSNADWSLLPSTGNTTAVFRIYNRGTAKDVFNASTAGTITFNQYGAGSLSTNSSGVIAASDGRYKTKTRSVTNALYAVMQLNPTYYRWNEDSEFHTEHEELGFIAQEVASVIPAASPEPEEEGKYKNYHDRAIIAVLTKAIQELKATNDDLQAQINELKER